MPQAKLTEADVKRELDDFRDRFPKLKDDQLFLLWFLRAYITADEMEAAEALTGGSNDKGIDAVLIDDDTKNVFIVQGKYRENLSKKNETRNDVVGFAEVAYLLAEDEEFAAFKESLSTEVYERLAKARRRLLKDGYRLRLFFVTTGKCSAALEKEARHIAQVQTLPATLEVVDWQRVLSVLDYYLRDVAPPVRSLDLEMETGAGVQVKGIFHRYDGALDIESWVFSMTCHGVAEMFDQAGTRLFALNIRGYLGNKETSKINKGMEITLSQEPEYFWYYNNGLTIVCDGAEKISSHGKDILRVTNPQVINGQQTTRTLANASANGFRASVTVRVIRIPHAGADDANHFDVLVPRIVKATNWQNAIVPSDLVSNDRRQIELQRQFRKLGYWYVRKRQTRSEAKKEAGAQHYYMIEKTELAQAVAACDLDPAVVRGGKEKLFEDRLYGQVFPNSDPYFYLCRYWLMNCVGAAARGYPERAYAKWLVLNFVWSHIRPMLLSKAKKEQFRRHWEMNGDALEYLWRANNAAFNAALRFFRSKRGKGAKAQDVSSFFKRKNLHREFERFWRGSQNTYRTKFQNALQRFERELTA